MRKQVKLTALAVILPVMALAGVPVPIMGQEEITAVVLPNPVGFPEITFVGILLALAFWKTGWLRVILSICIIIWGVFALPYDYKISIPLVALGTLLFVEGILALTGYRDRLVEWVRR